MENYENDQNFKSIIFFSYLKNHSFAYFSRERFQYLIGMHNQKVFKSKYPLFWLGEIRKKVNISFNAFKIQRKPIIANWKSNFSCGMTLLVSSYISLFSSKSKPLESRCKFTRYCPCPDITWRGKQTKNSLTD